MNKEVKNISSHIIGGILITILWFLIFDNLWAAVFGAFQLGLSVEACQFFYHDNKEWRLPDRFFDLLEYMIGSGIVVIIIIKFFS
jgi:hypothetical protein